jgi:hypothetical protein
MKLKILTSIAGESFSYKPGDVAEIEAEEAARWVSAGFAVPVVEQPEVSTVAKEKRGGKQ